MFSRFALCAAALGVACAAPAFGADLNFLPALTQVSAGDSVQLMVGIEGLGDMMAPSLGAYDVTVQYDAALFSFTDMSFGDPNSGDQLDLSGFGTFSSNSPGASSVEFFELSFDDVDTLNNQQLPSFVLATLNFQTLGAGVGVFSFSDVTLSDAIGNSIDVSSLGTAEVDIGSVVSSVPEPYMFAPISGVLIALWLRNRSRSGRTTIPF